MNKFKLMTDYFCYPLWNISSADDYTDIDPNTLPISSTLKTELMDWAKWFDGILNMEDPASSGFINLSDEIAFLKHGYFLYQKLQIELGSDYEVIYPDFYKKRLDLLLYKISVQNQLSE